MKSYKLLSITSDNYLGDVLMWQLVLQWAQWYKIARVQPKKHAADSVSIKNIEV